MTSLPHLHSTFQEFGDRAIFPGDKGYDEARVVFYGGADRHPAVIVQVKNADEVSKVVSAARASNAISGKRASWQTHRDGTNDVCWW